MRIDLVWCTLRCKIKREHLLNSAKTHFVARRYLLHKIENYNRLKNKCAIFCRKSPIIKIIDTVREIFIDGERNTYLTNWRRKEIIKCDLKNLYHLNSFVMNSAKQKCDSKLILSKVFLSVLLSRKIINTSYCAGTFSSASFMDSKMHVLFFCTLKHIDSASISSERT